MFATWVEAAMKTDPIGSHTAAIYFVYFYADQLLNKPTVPYFTPRQPPAVDLATVQCPALGDGDHIEGNSASR
jgi:hypothetical protein